MSAHVESTRASFFRGCGSSCTIEIALRAGGMSPGGGGLFEKKGEMDRIGDESVKTIRKKKKGFGFSQWISAPSPPSHPKMNHVSELKYLYAMREKKTFVIPWQWRSGGEYFGSAGEKYSTVETERC